MSFPRLLQPVLLIACTYLTGCLSIPLPDQAPATPGETARNANNYGYTPVDPLPIPPVDPTKVKDVLAALPDTTMRLAIGQFDSSGSVSYGPVKVGVAGNNYEVVLDYIQYTTKSFPVKISTTQPTAGPLTGTPCGSSRRRRPTPTCSFRFISGSAFDSPHM